MECKITAHYRKSEKSVTLVYKYSLREYYLSCWRYSGDREIEHKLVNKEKGWVQIVISAIMKIKWGHVTEWLGCVCVCVCVPKQLWFITKCQTIIFIWSLLPLWKRLFESQMRLPGTNYGNNNNGYLLFVLCLVVC